MEVIPAIVPQSFKDLEDKIGQIAGVVDVVHIDICDGKFTVDKSWPIINQPTTNDQQPTTEIKKIQEEKRDEIFEKILSGEMRLPYVKNVDYEIHLMTESPNDEAADWAKAGATRILLPIESGSDGVTDIINEWGRSVEIGLVANMETGVQIFESYLGKVETIQLMSIDVIGHQGEPFDEKVLEKIKRLREIGYKHKIAIDGGINLENAKKLIEAGADRLVVGSAIWRSDNSVETLKKFQRMTNH